MQRLAEICIKRPVFASMLILALVVIGAAAHENLAVDRLPSVDLPTVSVRTLLPGAAPEEVETEVSQVVEEAVNTVDGIDELRSVSSNGSSMIIATFRLETSEPSDKNSKASEICKTGQGIHHDVAASVIQRIGR